MDPGESFLPESQKFEMGGKRKNYPIFWEGKGKGNPQLKKNERRKLFSNSTKGWILSIRSEDQSFVLNSFVDHFDKSRKIFFYGSIAFRQKKKDLHFRRS